MTTVAEITLVTEVHQVVPAKQQMSIISSHIYLMYPIKTKSTWKKEGSNQAPYQNSKHHIENQRSISKIKDPYRKSKTHKHHIEKSYQRPITQATQNPYRKHHIRNHIRNQESELISDIKFNSKEKNQRSTSTKNQDPHSNTQSTWNFITKAISTDSQSSYQDSDIITTSKTLAQNPSQNTQQGPIHS